MGAGSGKQALGGSRDPLQVLTALFRELSIPADMHMIHCLFDIFHFLPCIGRYIKTNHVDTHSSPFGFICRL